MSDARFLRYLAFCSLFVLVFVFRIHFSRILTIFESIIRWRKRQEVGGSDGLLLWLSISVAFKEYKSVYGHYSSQRMEGDEKGVEFQSFN